MASLCGELGAQQDPAEKNKEEVDLVIDAARKAELKREKVLYPDV